ncbi:unnamed protein product [Gongylonema pulchrum]|uniref:Malonyl-CoA decarboxylase C-terminal domain-containing protein n=1 Tax=Gongylonema pulchrum TaxID=637853 RepID=A0A183E5V5_9BILA|nr:unnamed protein product [Gongylonema pulchrum]
MSVGAAARPHYFRLFQSIGNISGGVKRICSMRADVVEMLRASDLTRTESAALRPLENCLRELLTLWFCQSNLSLRQLTFESPGDILEKVIKYEAVHPMTGLGDMQLRLGPNRRCFVFMHEAMAREPLVVVYVVFMKKIAKNLQDILDIAKMPADESVNNTAVFYSISSTQPGLRGIDLGNMLIKRDILDVAKMPADESVNNTAVFYSISSTQPGTSGDIVDDRLIAFCEECELFEGDSKNIDIVRLFLLKRLKNLDPKK